MKILLVSVETWRGDVNGGNVLSNIFDGMDAEFAQIYCSAGTPNNAFCKKYFQITDGMVASSFLTRKPLGVSFELDNKEINTNAIFNKPLQADSFVFGIVKKFNLNTVRVMRDVLSLLSFWRSPDLTKFVNDFSPDVIFAPCYGSFFMHSMVRHVHQICGIPVISYISDDVAGYRQFSFSPVFWISRFFMRRAVIKTASIYSLMYTMTQEQMNESRALFKCPIKILRKSAIPSVATKSLDMSQPIKIIFAGNLYVGRFDVLKNLAKAIKLINQANKKFELHVYSSFKPSVQQLKSIHDGISVFFHGLVPSEILSSKYSESDIALHLESFSLRYKLLTRLSFSTKITECLSSGCAVMVISWNEHAGYKYLKAHDAAVCIDNDSEIYTMLEKLYSNPELISYYRERAADLCRIQHDPIQIRKMINHDFDTIARSSVF